MDAFIALLIEYGGPGMFVAAFLAGSILPFSSELVLVGLLAAGASPWSLLIWGTAGNTMGSLLNYGIGRLGREAWITRYAGVSPERLRKGLTRVRRYGAWAGLLTWLPVIGEVLTVAMGYLRVNLLYTILTVTVGKFVRYWLIVRAYAVL